MKNKWFINLFLCITKITGLLPAFIFMKPKVYYEDGAKRVLPKNCLLVSNHKSLLDFVLYLLIFPFNTIHFLMAEVLYNKGKFFSFLLNSWGGIKVERDDRDFSFIADSLDILNDNGIVGIFPESRLPINNKPFPFTTSAAFIALNSTSPVVPVYTDGNYGLLKRTSVCVGAPMYVSDYLKDGLTEQEQIEHITKVIESKVYELKSQMEAKASQHPLFSFKSIPMDMARLVCSVLFPIFRVRRFTADGKKYTKKIKGGAIIAANHTSFCDPFIVGITFWYRRMHLLVAESVMRNKFRTFLLKGVGAIKIDRNITDIEAITKSIDKLKSGYLLTVFPQGEIHRDDEIDTVKSGTVLLALRSSTIIQPIYVIPSKHWYSSRTVIIGNVINPKDFCKKKFATTSDISNITDALATELIRLKAVSQDFIGG